MNPAFNDVGTILVIDWPSPEVPELLARAGFQVIVKGGPGPQDFSVYEVKDGVVSSRHLGHPPGGADLVYSYRALSELSCIVAIAKSVRAKSIWVQSGFSAAGIRDPKGCWLSAEELRSAKELIESSGLNFYTRPYIGDVAREMLSSRKD